MTTYSITVSNTMNIYGGGAVNRWGSAAVGRTLVWQSAGVATFKNYWGSRADLELKITKQISNSVSLSSDAQKKVTKYISNILDFDSTTGKKITKVYKNTLDFDSNMTRLTFENGIWDYIYRGSNNLLAQSQTSWTSQEQTTTTWTTLTPTTTTWTEV